MRTLFYLVCLAFVACAGERSTLPHFISLPLTQSAKWNEAIPASKEVPVLREIYDHRSPLEDGIVYVDGKKGSKMNEPTGTIAHELTHGINSYLRETKRDFSGFYIPYVGASYLLETSAKRDQMASFIPKELRGIEGNGGRFYQYVQTSSGSEPDAGTYFDPSTGKKLWGHTNVYYIWDEWNAYINGGRADLEAEQLFGKQKWDSLTGPVEFMVYSLAGLMTIKKYDSAYLRTVHFQEAKDLFMFFTEQTLNLLAEGQGTSLSPEKANRYLDRLRNSQSAEARNLRKFLQDEFNPAWVNQFFGF